MPILATPGSDVVGSLLGSPLVPRSVGVVALRADGPVVVALVVVAWRGRHMVLG